jgi:hypothetical protein
MNLPETVLRVSEFFNIQSQLVWYPYADWSSLDKTRRGVYIITNTDATVPDVKYIYVGKGFFRARQSSHWGKLTGNLSPGQIDPKGWQWLREHHELDLSNWRLYLVDLPRETELSAMEGGLIHLLQPLANDETFVDRQKTG